MDPGELRSVWGYALLDYYVVHGLVIIFFLRSRQHTTRPLRWLVYATDVVWPAVISLFTTGQSNPFFLFFIFGIAAAAYRWGVWETVMTAVSSVSVLWLESLYFRSNWVPALVRNQGFFALTEFDPKRLFMRSIYLIVIGVLLGYLAEQQKRLRAEKDQAARLLSMVRLDGGLAGTLTEILGDLLKLYGASRALVASREGRSQKIGVGLLESRAGSELVWMDAGPQGMESYLGDGSALSAYVSVTENGDDRRFEAFQLNSNEVLVAAQDTRLFEHFFDLQPFRRLLAMSFSFGPELSGRIFLLDPTIVSSVDEDLHLLQHLVRQIGPAIYNVYLLRRLRSKAGALERARLVRELHDGAVQSLIAVEMQVDVVRRSYPVAETVAAELIRIQHLLREEVSSLRELMHQMKSTDIDARRLPAFLRDTVQRFQRETGIAAQFLMDEEELLLPQPVCRELARIAQEALVNVRKHSGASRVLVQLTETNGVWELIVEDNGAGFSFTGRVSQSELDAAGNAPTILRERVRLIEGELTIDSRPGRGARVEIRIPRAAAQTGAD